MADIDALKVEIDGDPGRYSALSDAEVADNINTKDVTRIRASMSGDEIFQQTSKAQFVGLAAAKQQMWVSFCARDVIDPSATANVDFVKFIFGDTGATITALNAARNENISRAEELGIGLVRMGDVQQARK